MDEEVHLRLSILTDELSSDLSHALRVCQDLAVSTVELRMVGDTNIVFYDTASLLSMKTLLDREGFRVCTIASPFLKCAFWHEQQDQENENRSDFDSSEQQWDILERSFRVAKLFDAPLVRTFSFWRAHDPLTVRETVLATIAEAVRRTEHAGLRLAIENEHACNIATGAETGWLLQHIPSMSFGALWDPGNEAALGSRPFPDGYHAVRDRIFHVHLKDVDQQRQFVKMGTGGIDYVGQFQALARDGYHGTLSLETHYQHQQGGLEQATRESLAAIRTIAQKADIALD